MYANDKYIDFFSVSLDDVINKNILEAVPPEDTTRIKAYMVACARSRTVTISRERTLLGPTPRYIRWVDIPIIDDLTGETVCIASIGTPDERRLPQQQSK